MRRYTAGFVKSLAALSLGLVAWVVPAGAAHAAPTGSAPIGASAYPVPAGAVFVSPSGADTAIGGVDRPKRTLASALRGTPDGGTVVLRAGNYHESVTMVPGRAVTIQAYPGEAVWFDGARTVDGWKSDGAAWRVDDWKVDLDPSPTYARGAVDGTSENWGFVRNDRPMAAHPDQVWVDGRPLTQVGSRAEVKDGTFFVDKVNQKLYSGTNPIGHLAEASDLGRAFAVRARGTVIRGIGVRRYAPSVPDQGAINSYYPDLTLENVVVDGSSTAGIGVYAENAKLRHVTVTRSGQLGIGARHADGLVMDDVIVTGNNTEGFNVAPSAGGIKVTTSRHVVLKNSLVADNTGAGFWADEAVYDVSALGNVVRDNSWMGIYYEISEKGVIEGNTVTGSGGFGIAIFDTGNVRIAKNVVLSKGEALSISQDSRTPAHPQGSSTDTRYDNPEMTWQVRNLDIRGNTFGGDGSATGGATATVRVDGHGQIDLRAQSPQHIVLDENTYTWVNARPRFVLFYSISADGAQYDEFTSLAPLRARWGQEGRGRVVGRAG